MDEENVREPFGNVSPDFVPGIGYVVSEDTAAVELQPNPPTGPIAVLTPEQETAYEVFHSAMHVILNQLDDDAEPSAIMDYSGITSFMLALYKVAPKGGIVYQCLNAHLDPRRWLCDDCI